MAEAVAVVSMQAVAMELGMQGHTWWWWQLAGG
jgi:hypothetical protein